MFIGSHFNAKISFISCTYPQVILFLIRRECVIHHVIQVI